MPASGIDEEMVRRKASWVTWQRITWLRGVAATMNLALKGHAAGPQQAQAYHQPRVWRKIGRNSHNIKQLLLRVLEKRKDTGKREWGMSISRLQS